MKNLWNPESPMMRRFACFANLVGLNLLWLITSLPIVTAGAATSAMYYTVFQYHTGESDSLIRPYFHAFRENFKQSTIFWIGWFLIVGLLCIEAVYLYGFYGGQVNVLWLPIFVAALLMQLMYTYALPQIGRFRNSLRRVLGNALRLSALHPLISVAMAALNLFPAALLLLLPQKFFATLFLWIMVGFSLTAYLNGYLLLKLFEKYTSE